MTADELQSLYHREAALANATGLTVTVSVALQQLYMLRQVNAALEVLITDLNHAITLLEKPPIVVQPAAPIVDLSPRSGIKPLKKDSST